MIHKPPATSPKDWRVPKLDGPGPGSYDTISAE